MLGIKNIDIESEKEELHQTSLEREGERMSVMWYRTLLYNCGSQPVVHLTRGVCDRSFRSTEKKVVMTGK